MWRNRFGIFISGLWMGAAALFFLCPCAAMADAPQETYYVHPSNIDSDVLRDAIGVMSVLIPVTQDDPGKGEAGVMALHGEDWLFVKKTNRINTYTPGAGTFKADGPFLLK